MDVGTATDTGGWKLIGDSVVIDALFDGAPIVCGDCVFRPWFAMHYSHVVSISSFAIILTRKRYLVARF